MNSLKKPFYSALVFFGTLAALSVGYAAYNLSTESANAPLTATKWNNMINAVNDLDTRVSSLVAGGGNLWSTGATNSINYSAGNVGIGKAIPSASLDIKRTTADANFAGYIEGIDIANYGLGVNIANTTSGKAIADFKSGNTSRLFVRADGNIGIGTVSPNYKLDVQGGNIRLGNGNETTFFGGNGSYIAGNNVGSNLYALQLNRSAGGSNVDLFGTGGTLVLGAGSTNASQFTLLGNGNVGIGTASPAAKLDVSGTVNLQSDVYIGLYERLGFYRYQSAGNNTGWLHLKTNQGMNSVMQTVEFKGYEYGGSKTINAQVSYYPYGPSNDILSINASGTHNINVYKAADGTCVIAIQLASEYFTGFMLNQYGPGPQGLFPLTIAATTWSTSSTGAF